MIRVLAFSAFGASLVLAGLGCNSARVKDQQASASYQHLWLISKAYMQATYALDRPPANTNELGKYVTELGGDPDTILRSPDDGEPYVILWGVDCRKVTGYGPKAPVIAYERTSKQGKRLVAHLRYVTQMTDDEFLKATFPPGQGPPSL